MRSLQSLRFFSIVASIVVGVWLPLRLTGFGLASSLQPVLGALIALASALNIYLHFKESAGSSRVERIRDWRAAGVLADAACLLIGSWYPPLWFLNVLLVRHVARITRFLDEICSLQPVTYGLLRIGLGSGNELVARLGEGSYFGEMALVSDKPRSATARAEAFCRAYSISRDSFRRVIQAYPEFRSQIETVAGSRRESA